MININDNNKENITKELDKVFKNAFDHEFYSKWILKEKWKNKIEYNSEYKINHEYNISKSYEYSDDVIVIETYKTSKSYYDFDDKTETFNTVYSGNIYLKNRDSIIPIYSNGLSDFKNGKWINYVLELNQMFMEEIPVLINECQELESNYKNNEKQKILELYKKFN